MEKRCRDAGLRVVNANNPTTPVMGVVLNHIDAGPSLNLPKDRNFATTVRLDLFQPKSAAGEDKALTVLFGFERLIQVGQMKMSQAEVEDEFLKSVDGFIKKWRHDNQK